MKDQAYLLFAIEKSLMKKEQCPICYSGLEVIDCAPCDSCGHLEIEIEHFKSGKHNYNVYNVYKGLKLQLCDFCRVDFGSYKSEYLGFDNDKRIGYESFEFLYSAKHLSIEKDKYCPQCKERLKFLLFLRDLREILKTEKKSGVKKDPS